MQAKHSDIDSSGIFIRIFLKAHIASLSMVLVPSPSTAIVHIIPSRGASRLKSNSSPCTYIKPLVSRNYSACLFHPLP